MHDRCSLQRSLPTFFESLEPSGACDISIPLRTSIQPKGSGKPALPLYHEIEALRCCLPGEIDLVTNFRGRVNHEYVSVGLIIVPSEPGLYQERMNSEFLELEGHGTSKDPGIYDQDQDGFMFAECRKEYAP